MEWVIGIAIVTGVLWYFARNREAKEQRVADLGEWEHVHHQPPYRTTFTVNFARMRATEEREVTDDPELNSDTEYLVRRTSKGWQVRLTDEAYRAALREERQHIASDRAFKFAAEERLAELEKGNTWEPVGDEVASGLETAYQRYIRHV